MNKRLPIMIILLVFVLSGCSLLGASSNTETVSDAQMATRVAELLSTMTTPTTEIDFPPTPTATVALPTVMLPTTTATTVVTEVITATPESAVTETASTATSNPTTETAATATPAATATAVAGDPATSLGTPTGSDDLTSFSNWGWPNGEDQYLRVNFKDGFMEMTGLTNFAGWRLPLIGQQLNTYIELTANSGTCKGKDSYGIIFRVPVLKEPTQGYLYEVTCDGYYRLWKWDGEVEPNGKALVLVAWSQSSLINAGVDQTNRLGVKIVDNTYTLYMNGEKLASATDTSFKAGFFGVFVRSVETDDYTVKFDSMRYWENP